MRLMHEWAARGLTATPDRISCNWRRRVRIMGHRHSARAPHAGAALSERSVYALSAAFWCVIAPCWLWLKLVVRHRMVLATAGLIVLLPTWLALSRLQHDATLLLLLLAVIWIADTAAYFSGRALGRHKLAPSISPGKTWEGVGGAFAAVTVYALTLYFSLFLTRCPQFAAHLVVPFCRDRLCTRDRLNRGSSAVRSQRDGAIFPARRHADRIDVLTAALCARR
jgi:hypothetical protein